jgi:hypothetical protein
VLVVALAATACATGGSGEQASDEQSGSAAAQDSESDGSGEPSNGESASGSESGEVTALQNPNAESLPEPLIDFGRVTQILSPDGIPSIDDPKFLDTSEVDFIDDREPVLSLEVGDTAKAYPLQIMTWHEIVNDSINGKPVTVSYCPLCNSAIAYNRTVNGESIEFGTSGSLYKSALIMYDRRTESLWSHFTGKAVAGELTGTELELIPVSTVAWEDWREANPDGKVLSRETGIPGYEQRYGVNPYTGYDEVGSNPFAFSGEVDGRLPAKARVVGIGEGREAIAVKFTALRDQPVIQATVGGRKTTTWFVPGTASALDTRAISQGRDVGSTGVFERTVDGQTLTFTAAEGEMFTDEQTGSTWNILGEAVEGPMKGTELTEVEHVDTFWFAWAAFQPDTVIVP